MKPFYFLFAALFFLTGNVSAQTPLPEIGPGGCTDQAACEAYCEKITNLEECVSFAEKYKVISDQELEQAQKIKSAIENGTPAPACNNKEECDIYCKEPSHMKECITFGMAAGLIQGEELEESKKILEALKKGVEAPRCNGKEECDVYCSQKEHLEECLNFSVAAGFITVEQAQTAINSFGKGAGGCEGKEECDAYCNQAEHRAECEAFKPYRIDNKPYDKMLNQKPEGMNPDGAYKVEKVEKSDKGLKIEGIAPPNSLVTIYIYSALAVVIVKSDANGNWQYEFDRPLENGGHTVYASVTNSTGDIQKVSEAFGFSKAENEIIKTLAPKTAESPTKNINKLFIIITGIAIIIALAAVALIWRAATRKNIEEKVNNYINKSK